MVQTICGTCVSEWCAFHGKPGNGCTGYTAPSPPTVYTNNTDCTLYSGIEYTKPQDVVTKTQ